MPHSEFIHLHVHTQYSLLDGACRIPDLLNLAKSFNMDSLAITDHGNLFGAIDFYTQAQKSGIKPIIGCEMYIAPGSRLEKSSSGIDEAAYHLLLLAKNERGYKNLMKLVSIGYLEGFYYRPRIDRDVLAKFNEGLIGLSACLKGEIPSLIYENRINQALKVADEFRQIFGRDNFYLELQDNDLEEQTKVNEGLLKIAKELTLEIVATCDVHYLRQEDAAAHDALLCIQTQAMLDNPNRLKFRTPEFYLKSPQEMLKSFHHLPQAIKNTLVIASRCNLELDFSKTHLPQYSPPQGMKRQDYLRYLCEEKINQRFKNRFSPQHRERLEHELKIINSTGFTSYFLIVWDFVNFAKKNNILVGPGRGSAAGSLVSYLLGITDIDPIEYGLLFERFLNPERKELPDIDIDFCDERRGEVINYATQKYGQENVAQIITFGTMQARGVIRDVGRVMGMSYSDVDRIAKMIPFDPNITLKTALESEPEMKNLYITDQSVKRLITTALSLEGLVRHASVHAAGVVIADAPLTEYMPLFKSQDGQITTGFSMGALSKIGLLKIDFLGLRTLTVIDHTLRIINERHKSMLKIEDIDLEDAKTFNLLKAGLTVGIFQLESSGMRDLLKKLEPHCFRDLIALLALYRPGPMGSGMLDDFIRRRHGRTPIHYDHKKLEPILKETHGIIVYQEQVMQIASVLAGFSLTQADRLRRAMSKKIPEVMEEERKNFMLGCKQNNITEAKADKIFKLIEYFSGYGFNLSHSTAYAMISYRTAYLKANHPLEFMTALLNSERQNSDKIVIYIGEAAKMGLKVLPPDINKSNAEFKIESENSIRFGLLAIKNVGAGAIQSIVESRQKWKEFRNLEDFCQHIDLRLTNRKVIESLIKAGTMDCLGLIRAQMSVSLNQVLDFASQIQKEKRNGQLSFFDTQDNFGFKRALQLPKIKEWPQPQLLAFEKDMLGFYVSGHPLTHHAKEMTRFKFNTSNELKSFSNGNRVKIIGLITKSKITTTRSTNEKMAILKLEDLEGAVEVLVFPRTYKIVARNIMPNSIVYVKGKISLREGQDLPAIISEGLLLFEELYNLIKTIFVDITAIKENLFESLKQILDSSRGLVPVHFYLNSADRSSHQRLIDQQFYVQPSQKLIDEIEAVLGENRVSLAMQ